MLAYSDFVKELKDSIEFKYSCEVIFSEEYPRDIEGNIRKDLFLIIERDKGAEILFEYFFTEVNELDYILLIISKVGFEVADKILFDKI